MLGHATVLQSRSSMFVLHDLVRLTLFGQLLQRLHDISERGPSRGKGLIRCRLRRLGLAICDRNNDKASPTQG